MSLYLVSCDLSHQKDLGDYEGLMGELKNLGAKQVLLSQWALGSKSSAVELRDHLKPFVHSDDRLVVCTMGSWAAWRAMSNMNDV